MPASSPSKICCYRFPIRYEDRSRLQPIASLKPGQTASIAGRVLSCGLRSTRRPGFKIFEALVGDAERRAAGRLAESAVPARRVRAGPAGRAVRRRRRCAAAAACSSPIRSTRSSTRKIGETIHTGRIVPVYEKTGSVTPKIQRRLVHDALQRLPPDLPDHSAGGAATAARPARAPCRAAGGAFSARRRSDRRSEPLRDAGAAAADFRRGVPVSARRAGAAAIGGRGAQAAFRSASTIASANRRGGCCRSG